MSFYQDIYMELPRVYQSYADYETALASMVAENCDFILDIDKVLPELVYHVSEEEWEEEGYEELYDDDTYALEQVDEAYFNKLIERNAYYPEDLIAKARALNPQAARFIDTAHDLPLKNKCEELAFYYLFNADEAGVFTYNDSQDKYETFYHEVIEKINPFSQSLELQHSISKASSVESLGKKWAHHLYLHIGENFYIKESLLYDVYNKAIWEDPTSLIVDMGQAINTLYKQRYFSDRFIEDRYFIEYEHELKIIDSPSLMIHAQDLNETADVLNQETVSTHATQEQVR